MADEGLTTKKVSVEEATGALEELRKKGSDINPYSLAEQLKVHASVIVTDGSLMELLSIARGDLNGIVAAEYDRLLKKVEELESKLEPANGSSADPVELQKQLDELKAQYDALKEKSPEDLQKEIAELKEELELWQQENSELEERLENSLDEEQMSELNRKLLEVVAINSDLREQLEASASQEDLEELNKELLELVRTNTELREQMEKLEKAGPSESSVAAVMSETAELNKNIEEQAQKISELNSVIEEQSDKLSELNKVIAEHEDKFADERAANEAHEAARSLHADQLASLNQEMLDLQTLNLDLLEKYKALEAQHAELQQQISASYQQGYDAAKAEFTTRAARAKSTAEHRVDQMAEFLVSPGPMPVHESVPAGEELILEDGSQLIVNDSIADAEMEPMAAEGLLEPQDWTEADSRADTQEYALPNYMNSGLFNNDEAEPVQSVAAEAVEPQAAAVEAAYEAQGTYETDVTGFDPAAASHASPAEAYDPNAAVYETNAAHDPNFVHEANAALDPNVAYETGAAHDPYFAHETNAAHDPDFAYETNAAHDPDFAHETNAAHDSYLAYDPNAAQDPNLAYNPNAAHDPNLAYDHNAVHDPNLAYDHNAAFDPNLAYDPNAAHDPNLAYDHNAAFDPNLAYDPNAAHDPNLAYDPNAAYDANSGYDPNAVYGTESASGAEAYDSSSANASAFDAHAAQAPLLDPNAANTAYDPYAAHEQNAVDYDPHAQNSTAESHAAFSGGFGDPNAQYEPISPEEAPAAHAELESPDEDQAGTSGTAKKSTKKTTSSFDPNELRDLIKKKVETPTDPEAQPKLHKFVGGKHVGDEKPHATANMPRVVSPDIRRACLLLGVKPEELSKQTVLDAWKREFAKPGVHPDTGGDTEMAMYLNNAKDTLIRYLDAQAPKLGKVFGSKSNDHKDNK